MNRHGRRGPDGGAWSRQPIFVAEELAECGAGEREAVEFLLAGHAEEGEAARELRRYVAVRASAFARAAERIRDTAHLFSPAAYWQLVGEFYDLAATLKATPLSTTTLSAGAGAPVYQEAADRLATVLTAFEAAGGGWDDW